MKGGTIRRIANTFKRLLGRPITAHYKNPVLRDPRDRKKKRASGSGSGRFTVERIRRFGVPPCRPGTVTYHDKLVRHFGRRRAEGYRIAIQRGHLNCLPTAADFAANRPWAHLK